MKKVVKKILKYKSNGEQFIEASICILATTICSACIILCFSVWMTQYSTNDTLNLIQTSYMKKMEIAGCLTSEDEIALKKELTNAGIKNVSLTGTTTSQTVYGQPIDLVITGDVNLSDASISSFSHFADTVEFLQKKLKIENFGKFTYNKRISGTSKC
jgi:hypothetical protein